MSPKLQFPDVGDSFTINTIALFEVHVAKPEFRRSFSNDTIALCEGHVPKIEFSDVFGRPAVAGADAGRRTLIFDKHYSAF